MRQLPRRTGVRILLDLVATQPGAVKFHGASEYAKAVFRELQLLRQHEVLLGFYDPNRPLDPEMEATIQQSGGKLFAITAERDLQELIDGRECHRVYSALPHRHYNIDFSQVELIFTIHGLRSIEMPTDKYEIVYQPSFLGILKYVYKHVNRQRHIRKKKRRLARLLNVRARRKTIVVDSYHTKYALLSNFPDLAHAEIRVIYPPRKRVGVTERSWVSRELSEKFNVSPRGYLLLISGNRWIKNVFRAVRALDEIFSDCGEIDKKVLVVGVDNPRMFGRHIRNRDKFGFFGYVDELELEFLYKNAYLFIYPTLNEGFGLPLLESMKYGTPVICSAITSTTEVGGDAALYFNPFSVEEIKNRLLLVLFETGVWEKYALLGKERSRLVAAKQDRMLHELCRLILAS